MEVYPHPKPGKCGILGFLNNTLTQHFFSTSPVKSLTKFRGSAIILALLHTFLNIPFLEENSLFTLSSFNYNYYA